MEGQPVGKPLLKYLNENSTSRFTDIKVVNDTITSLFAGLLNPGFDAYIGLIVGTGTNMATFFPSEYIPKIRNMKDWSGETPVNLESGNFLSSASYCILMMRWMPNRTIKVFSDLKKPFQVCTLDVFSWQPFRMKSSMRN